MLRCHEREPTEAPEPNASNSRRKAAAPRIRPALPGAASFPVVGIHIYVIPPNANLAELHTRNGELGQVNNDLVNLLHSVQIPIVILGGDLRMRPEETENRFIYNLGKAQWDIAKLRELLENFLPKDSRFENFEMDAKFPGAGRKKLVLNARRIADDGLKMKAILLAMEETKAP